MFNRSTRVLERYYRMLKAQDKQVPVDLLMELSMRPGYSAL
jgi:hypothetical protein